MAFNRLLCGARHYSADGSLGDTYIDNHMLIIMNQGTLDCEVNGVRSILPNGHYMHLHPHSIYSTTNKGTCSFFWMHFYHSSEGHEKNAEIFGLNQTGRIVLPDRVRELMQMLIMYQAESLSDSDACLLLLQVLIAELRSHREPNSFYDSTRLATQARTEILLHLSSEISTKEIAATLGCNPDYLGRLFKQFFNQTISEFIHQMRIEMSKCLLHFAHHSIASVAQSCGFKDPVYFTRVFKRLVGKTPSQYQSDYQSRKGLDITP